MQKFSIAIHGGAGTIEKENITADLEAAYTAGLRNALHKGYEVLAKKGSSIEAVKQAIIVLEDNPLFNAGKGSVFTANEKHEMDYRCFIGTCFNDGGVRWL